MLAPWSPARRIADRRKAAFFARTEDGGRLLEVVAMSYRRYHARLLLDHDLYDPEGRLAANRAAAGFHQPGNHPPVGRKLRYHGRPRARPGNWLPTGGVERYVLCCASMTPIGVATVPGVRCRRSARGPACDPRIAGPWRVLLGTHLATVLLLSRIRKTPIRACHRWRGSMRSARFRADAREGRHAVHGPGLRDVGVPV